MRRPHTLLAALLLAAGTAAAQDYGQAATLKIWDNTTAPHSNGIATPEREPEPNRIADVSQAVLYIFPADPAKATGQAVVICPGGGYVKLCIDYEGYDMAKWFAANGITAAVLKYRMPNGHPTMPTLPAVNPVAPASSPIMMRSACSTSSSGTSGWPLGMRYLSTAAVMRRATRGIHSRTA